MTAAIDPFIAINTADTLAPIPDRRDAPTEAWVRHYAALALAAFAAFRHSNESSDRDSLILIGVTATAAARALTVPTGEASAALWDLTPEAGALNGEWEEWLVDTLDALGVNPADIDPDYTAADFTSQPAGQPA